MSQAGPWTLLAAPPAVAALLALTALIGGRTITRALPSRGRLEQALVALPMGLLLLAEIGLALGCVGHLTVVPLLAALSAVHLTGIASWRWLLDVLRIAATRLRVLAAGGLAATGVGAAAALLPAGVLAIYPPTGFDATLYHLPFAKAFALSGRLPFLPDLRVPIFPQLNEMLLALALLLGSDAAAQLLMTLATLLTAALLVHWGRAAFPDAPGAGWIAAAAWLGNPLVVYLGGSAYVDPALAMWVTAALYAVHRYRAGGGTGWLAASAAFTGAAAAGKYLGLFFVVAIAAIVAAGARDRAARHAAAFILVVLAVMAPWYGRILYYTGNPLFPFFPRLFGGSPWDPFEVGSGAPWWRAASALPPLSPVYLAALPLVAWRAARDARTRRLLLLVAAFAGATLALPPDPRYLLPVVPVASLALGVSLASWPPFMRLSCRRRIAAACAALLLPGWLYGVIRIVHLGPPPASRAAREALLARQLPLYPAVRFLNRRSGSAYTAFGFGTENLHYFADGRLLGDWAGPASYRRMPPPGGDPQALAGILRRMGARYLILPAGACRAARIETAGFRREFRLLYTDPHARAFAVSDLTANDAEPVTNDFGDPRRVEIRGYDGDAMEPFVSRDGRWLFFNNRNDPPGDTDLFFARRIDDGHFDFLGPLAGANEGPPVLDAVPSLDDQGHFFFISTRAYAQTGRTLFTGVFADGRVSRVGPVAGNFSPRRPGWLTMDAEISADGQWLYFANALFTGGAAPAAAQLGLAERSGSRFLVTSRTRALLQNLPSSRPTDLDYAPATSADNLELYLTRWSPPGPNLRILRASRPTADLPFGAPERIASIQGFVEAPSLSGDGKTLYFHKQEGGRFSIYRVTRRR